MFCIENRAKWSSGLHACTTLCFGMSLWCWLGQLRGCTCRTRCSTRTRKEELARESIVATPRMLEARRNLANASVIQHWHERLSHARVGLRVVETFQPVFKDWLRKSYGSLSFLQVLSGHGCFREYLHEITGREVSPRCHHCPEERDTAQHTLKECPA